jgi:Membrane proteins related to metalloendopeptidases
MIKAVLRAGAAIALLSGGAWSAAGATDEPFHVVAAGETLNGIANRAGVSPATLAEANNLRPPYIVKVGQKLNLPRSAAVRTAARVIPARTAAPVSATAPEQASVHMVTAGETLGGIAARAKVPRILIAEANGLQAPYVVKVGQKLLIPRTRHHKVAAGETGFAIAMQYGVPWEQVALANDMAPDTPVKIGQNLLIPTMLNPPTGRLPAKKPSAGALPEATPSATAPTKAPRFGWPVSGPIRRAYVTGADYHDGLDITAAQGTMVRAAAAGTVKFAGKEQEQFGNLVVLDHGDGWFTAYGFLSRITVKEGARVAAGERIGLVGNTGLAKGNELHFEVRRDGKPVDPLDELPTAP